MYRQGGLARMQYLLLIYGNEGRWNKVDAPERENVLGEFGAFTQSIHQSGHLRGGNELDSPRRRRL